MYESAFQMGSDGFVFAGTGGRDSAVCSAGGLCRCSAGRADPLQWAAAALAVPVSRGIALTHPMPGKRPAGPAVPSGGVGHRHPHTLCGTGALHRVPGWLCTSASAAAQAVRTGQLTAEEADALLPACICSGPSFVVLTVGQSLLGSAELGVLLFASQITANYLTAALLNRFAGVRSVKPGSAAPASPAPPRLDEILADAAITYCKLCGFILFFRMLAAGAGALLPAGAGTLCAVLLEVCSGCDLASRTGRWGSLLCCAALSVQGLSVLLQVRTICPPEMTLRPLYWARLLHLPLSLALFYLLLPGGEADVFSTLPARVLLMRRVSPDCALLVFAVCCMAACTLRSGIRQVEQKQMARNAGGCCINSKTLL